MSVGQSSSDASIPSHWVPILPPPVSPQQSSEPHPETTANELRLVTWLVEVGESVQAHDRLAELVLPGLLIYATAPASGTITRLSARPHQQVIGERPIAWLLPD